MAPSIFVLQLKSLQMLVQIRDARGNMVYEENLENYSGTYDHTISLGNEAKEITLSISCGVIISSPNR